MGAARASKHVIRRVGQRGIYMNITSARYEVPDAEDDSRRYLKLIKEIGMQVVGVTDYSAMRALDPGVRTTWAKVMADHGKDYEVVHALLPEGTIGKIVAMALSAWGLIVGVRMLSYVDRAKWKQAAALDGVTVPEREATLTL